MKDFWQDLSRPFFVLAPMDDVTDYPFRKIVAACARPDVFFTEFVNTDGLCSKGRDVVMRRLKFDETEHPIVAQIWGTNPENYYRSAKIIASLGFDGIDINMGCPVRKVVSRGSCSALIENHKLAGEIIQATQEGAGLAPDGSRLPVSVKTRIGLKVEKTEEWVGFLLTTGISALTIHARTAREESKVPARWEEIGKAADLRDKMKVDTLIIGNGDVMSREEGLEKVEKYGVDGVMIGRGIFQNPWVFESNQAGPAPEQPQTHPTLGPTPVSGAPRSVSPATEPVQPHHSEKERLGVLLDHMNLFEKTWGRRKNFHLLKKFFKIYVRDFDGSSELRAKLMECEDGSSVREVVRGFLDQA